MAVHPEPVESRRPERGGEVAVASAAGLDVVEREADLFGQTLRVPEEGFDPGPLLVGRPVHPARDLDPDLRIERGEAEDAGAHLLADFRVRDPHVDLRPAFGGHHVRPGPPGDDPHVDGHPALVVGHVLEAQDLPGHLPDRAPAVLVPHPGMGGAPRRRHLEDRDPLASGDDAPAVAGRLGDEDVAGGPRGRLDDRARRGAPHLLLRHEQEGDGERGLTTGPDEVPERVPRETGPALHVVDAGAVDPVALPPHTQDLVDGADGVDGVEVAQHEDAGPVAAPFAARGEEVPVAVPSRGAVDAGGERPHRRLDVVHHPVDRFRIMRRRLDPDPFEDLLQELVRVDARFVAAGGGGGGRAASVRGRHCVLSDGGAGGTPVYQPAARRLAAPSGPGAPGAGRALRRRRAGARP